MTGVISRYVEAWQGGDLETVLACYAPDIVAHYGGASRFAGDHHGRDRFVEVLAETTVASGRRLVSIEQLHDAGDHGSVFVVEAITVDGVEREVHRALRFRVADDEIVEVWLHDMDQHLVDAAWR